jgi:hypothetical protein
MLGRLGCSVGCLLARYVPSPAALVVGGVSEGCDGWCGDDLSFWKDSRHCLDGDVLEALHRLEAVSGNHWIAIEVSEKGEKGVREGKYKIHETLSLEL